MAEILAVGLQFEKDAVLFYSALRDATPADWGAGVGRQDHRRGAPARDVPFRRTVPGCKPSEARAMGLTIEEAIRTAIEYEQKVAAVYREAAAAVSDDAGRRVFAALAAEEDGHVRLPRRPPGRLVEKTARSRSRRWPRPFRAASGSPSRSPRSPIARAATTRARSFSSSIARGTWRSRPRRSTSEWSMNCPATGRRSSRGFVEIEEGAPGDRRGGDRQRRQDGLLARLRGVRPRRRAGVREEVTPSVRSAGGDRIRRDSPQNPREPFALTAGPKERWFEGCAGIRRGTHGTSLDMLAGAGDSERTDCEGDSRIQGKDPKNKPRRANPPLEKIKLSVRSTNAG